MKKAVILILDKTDFRYTRDKKGTTKNNKQMSILKPNSH